ncbi:MAG: hypothetical protein SFW67_25925 [Myxococcaceae bacterium]|nr:hypothetical protein [Myxococcaceae bacterium]
MRPKNVSLVDEFAALGHVIESAEMLAEMIVNGELPDVEAQSRAPKMVAAVLGMAKGRVELLRQVVLRQADPKLLVGRSNYRLGPVQRHEDPDIILGPKARVRRRGAQRRRSR